MAPIGKNINTLGIDIGGTKIETALIDASGNIISSHYQLMGPSKTPDIIIADIIESAKVCLKKSGMDASAMGIGIAGQIDRVRGIVRRSPNLPEWHDVALSTRLHEALNMPILINNDVRVITWAEWQYGAGKGVNDLICLFVGTGVGGGIVSNGRLLEGYCNTAGELGHMTIVAGGRKCHCPNEGCLEAYVGGWAIADRAKDAAEANPSGGKTLVNLAGKIADISAITVSQAYQVNDPLSQRIVKDTARYLAAGIVSIVNAFNPHLIILGGSVIQGLPDLIPLAEKRIFNQALQTPLEGLRITTAALGNKAGVVGAATLARSLVN
jgi:glucokinase